ncbi:hypothetical protein HGRIS_014888 [Hohenbuehelia grisea]|uniref:Uncharacterized protein n=1 Tax=Hohenbuehelia grisea TaxID=104357 RepID=A0ABR3IR32_9AGAR
MDFLCAQALTPHCQTLFKAIKTGVDTPVGGSTRCWPKKSADEKIGIRFDWGGAAFRDPHGLWWRILNLQLNANAESEAIRKEAQKNGTDDTRSKIYIPTTPGGKALHPDIGEKEVREQITSEILTNGV